MTSDSQNNSPNHPQNDHGDNEVLTQLYKKGAKETPPTELNSKIINYAANPHPSTEAPTSVGSHFGGGWKVPLSMAASVVVVFALLVQLDQTPQQLELPPIPEISIPTEDNAAKNQSMSDEYNDKPFEAEDVFKNDGKESNMGSQSSDALIIDNPTSTKTQRPTDSVQTEPVIVAPITVDPITTHKSAASKAEEKTTISREHIQIQQESTATPPSISISKSEKGYAPLKPESLARPQAAKKQIPTPPKESLNHKATETTTDTILQHRSTHERQDSNNTSDMAAGSELSEELATEKTEEFPAKLVKESAEKYDSSPTQTESEFTPIPVEDWLLMIEKLVAQKDYAEAARQLMKFKQAHPKVNVEDLDAKIP